MSPRIEAKLRAPLNAAADAAAACCSNMLNIYTVAEASDVTRKIVEAKEQNRCCRYSCCVLSPLVVEVLSRSFRCHHKIVEAKEQSRCCRCSCRVQKSSCLKSSANAARNVAATQQTPTHSQPRSTVPTTGTTLRQTKPHLHISETRCAPSNQAIKPHEENTNEQSRMGQRFRKHFKNFQKTFENPPIHHNLRAKSSINVY